MILWLFVFEVPQDACQYFLRMEISLKDSRNPETGLGEGLGNFLTWGEFPGTDNRDTAGFLVPRAVIKNRDLSHIEEPNPKDFELMKEFVAHSWYEQSKGDEAGLHPFEGETKFNFTGPKPPYDQLEVEQKYSWLKSARAR